MYYLEDDSDHREPLTNGLESSEAMFKIEAKHENCCLYLVAEDGTVLITWNGVQSEPNYEFIDHHEPAKSDWMLEQERQDAYYWQYERHLEGSPEL